MKKNVFKSQALILVLGYIPVIPALGRLRQEDCGFQTSLDYIAKTLSKKKKKTCP
jgi:hypothetical protein